MVIKRIWRHLTVGYWHFRQEFSESNEKKLLEAIRNAEKGHLGEIRVVIETKFSLFQLLQGLKPCARALEVFSLEKIWDTAENNGVLLYILLAENHIEIVADRGFNGRISPNDWGEICENVKSHLPEKTLCPAICEAIAQIGEIIRAVFPGTKSYNQLTDQVVLR